MRFDPKIKFTAAALLVSVVAFAGPVGPPPPQVPPPPGLPIDSGVMALAVAALVYGLYKVHQFKQNKKTPA